MAEIRVERKRGTNPWVWVLVAVIVIAAAIWLLVDNGMIGTASNLEGGNEWRVTTSAFAATRPA